MEIVEETDEDAKLRHFIETIDIESDVFDYLKNAGICCRHLQYLTADDIKDAIQPIGLRAEFREKLFAYKRSGQLDAWKAPTRVTDWLRTCMSPSSSSERPNLVAQVLDKSLRVLFSETSKGKRIMTHANKYGVISKTQRNEVIEIIMDYVTEHNLQLGAKNCHQLFDEICQVFPSEVEWKDFYYIPRKGRSNTGGRLFVRYKNIVSKRRHSMKFSKGSSSKSSSPAATEDNYWLDDNKLYAFKLCLSVENNENEDWHDVCEKWTETFPLRQRELKQRHKEVFLLGWPKLRHEKFMELINIDFEHMHCFKNQLLHSKWPEFKLKICQHYKQIAHKPPFKALFEHAVKSKDMAVQDYMYAILLLFILPATARFVNETGKTSRRVSVSESQESFVLHVNSIDEHEELMAAMKKKWFAQDLTIQPCLIVEGSTDMDMDINTYYVHFNSRLTQMSSFLDSLDLCFKIFQVLHIPYPKACFEVWLFIQKYFYEIDAEADCKSSNITALIAILDGINISI